MKQNYRIGKGLPLAFILFIIFAGWMAPSVVSAAAPVKVGEKAPQFEIQGFNSQSLEGKKNLLVVFYRGHF